MQQSAFRQTHPSGTRLPLAKFSYTTTPIDYPGPLSWNHINGHGDLVSIFDKVAPNESTSSKLIMKVLRNDAILEQIDITRLVHFASLQNGPVPKSPFAVVIKSPCLAVKYPLNGSQQIRRFQLKFNVERDYYTALALLSEINCPFTEGNVTAIQPTRRLPSSSSWTSFQAPTVTTWKNGNTARTPDSNSTEHFHPVANWPGGMTSLRPPSPAPYTTPNIAPIGQEPKPSITMPQNSESQLISTNNVPGPPEQTTHPADPSSRPSTAQAYHDLQELNEVLPPKRDLPFLKSGAKRKRTKSTTQAAAEKPKSSRLSLLANQSNHNTLERCESIMSDTSSQSLVPTQVYPEPMEPPSTQPYIQPDMGVQAKKPIERLAKTVSAAVSRNAPNIVQVERTQSPSQRAAPVSVEDQLAAYLSFPNPERVQFLENWMCELIDDDGFMTLCQDVEATWRRFAFGMKK